MDVVVTSRKVTVSSGQYTRSGRVATCDMRGIVARSCFNHEEHEADRRPRRNDYHEEISQRVFVLCQSFVPFVVKGQ